MRHLTTSLDNAGGAGQATASDISARLTERQGRMLRWLAAGACPREIGARLSLSPRLLAREQRAILTTLGVSSLAEARVVWWGSRAGAREDLRLAATALIPSRPPATPTAA